MNHKKLTSLFIILILIIALFKKHKVWTNPKEELDRLNKKMLQLYRKGKYSEVIEIALKVLEVESSLLAPDHPDTATSL
jgi:hypothetical protein